MIPVVAAALADVARLMHVARRPWWIIGSGAVVLHGADAGDVRDIDVLVDFEDMPSVLAVAGVSARAMRPDPLFRSDVFAIWHGTDLPVEMMAGFAVASTGGWWPVRPETRLPVPIGDDTVFVPQGNELVALFRRMGRSKDLRRAAALEEREPG